MRTILQRVSEASVTVDQKIVGQISQGWLVLLGIQQSDTANEVKLLIDKITKLRAFNDADGKMNLDLSQVNGSLLIVSQFTLYGECNKGRRPSFTAAAKPDHAKHLYELFLQLTQETGFPVQAGIFAADMKIQLINDGPVTFSLDTDLMK